jgi:hypothetical protein
MAEKTFITIAKCGLACEVCQHFINRDCLGCVKENELNSRCLIFKCTVEKNIQYCIQCMEFPCKFMQGISKAYCPVFTEIKSKIKVLPYVVCDTLQDRDPKRLLKAQIETI